MPLERNPERLYLGHQITSIQHDSLNEEVLATLLSTADQQRFDFIVLPIETIDKQHDEWIQLNGKTSLEWVQTQMDKGAYSLLPFVESDFILPSTAWNNSIVLSMSNWIVIDDGKASSVAEAEQIWSFFQDAFKQQLSWASHCGAYATIIPTPTADSTGIRCARYASLLSRYLTGGISTQIWVKIPLITSGSRIDGWQLWSQLRQFIGICNIGIALEFTRELPENLDVLDRWIAEPIRAVIIPAEVFKVAQGGFPVLNNCLKEFLMKLMRQKVQIILQHGLESNDLSIEESINSSQHSGNVLSLSSLVGYAGRVFMSLPSLTEAERFEYSYLDYLQSPLQPLRDNLESQTYETFEKDPVKYAQYEEAVYRCLEDRLLAGKMRHVIMVVGAGRGPLVAATLRALRKSNIDKPNYRLVAVEKNVNAVITLRSRVLKDDDPGWQHVEIVAKDMRHYETTEKADIIISELLGSFGDNELSPECLDGAQALLAEDGVYIPSRYWSSLEPISTPKLWAECKSQRDECQPGIQKSLETSYVVQLHSVYRLSKEGPLKCFEFSHPSPSPIQSDNSHNNRYMELSFTAKTDALCHGMAGYFHCDLYKDISISIHPPTFSHGMFSWFPLYFPLHQPVKVQQNQTIKCHFWRLSNTNQIWYEWALSQPFTTQLHNVDGRSNAILK